MNFLRGKRRWGLFDDSAKARRQSFYFFRTQFNLLRRGSGFAFGVVGVGSETKSYRAFVSFLRRRVELRQAG